jgi:O-antigen biosynthesis protein
VRWIKRQYRRFLRFLALAPRLFNSPASIYPITRELCRVGVFNGIEGVKAYLRRIEKSSSEKAQEEKRLMRQTKEDVRRRCAATAVPGYVILGTSYTSNSAGVGCLYRLCHDLNRWGFPSFVTGSHRTNPDLTAPLIDRHDAKRLCAEGFVAVYPETISGNPLHARHVARWVLNRPGLLGGDKVYADSEMVFNYCNAFEPYIQNRIDGKLYMPTIDEDIFFCDENDRAPRGLECFYLGKSKWQDGFIDRDRVFEITRDTPSKAELGKLFRASRMLYCFDNSTILVYEALLCGCPVVIIPDNTQTREDFERLELGMDGIAWGIEEKDSARANVPMLRRRYAKVKADYKVQLAQFIAITQQRAGGTQVRRAA